VLEIVEISLFKNMLTEYSKINLKVTL